MNVHILVRGFSDDLEQDRFVKSEIRYLKSFDMSAARCAGRALLFRLTAFPRAEAYVETLRKAYPWLEISLHAEGKESRGPGAGPDPFPAIEEILYETF